MLLVRTSLNCTNQSSLSARAETVGHEAPRLHEPKLHGTTLLIRTSIKGEINAPGLHEPKRQHQCSLPARSILLNPQPSRSSHNPPRLILDGHRHRPQFEDLEDNPDLDDDRFLEGGAERSSRGYEVRSRGANYGGAERSSRGYEVRSGGADSGIRFRAGDVSGVAGCLGSCDFVQRMNRRVLGLMQCIEGKTDPVSDAVIFSPSKQNPDEKLGPNLKSDPSEFSVAKSKYNPGGKSGSKEKLKSGSVSSLSTSAASAASTTSSSRNSLSSNNYFSAASGSTPRFPMPSSTPVDRCLRQIPPQPSPSMVPFQRPLSKTLFSNRISAILSLPLPPYI
ncbi:hypothetical protein PS1_047530 [Malus domestica]